MPLNTQASRTWAHFGQARTSKVSRGRERERELIGSYKDSALVRIVYLYLKISIVSIVYF